MSAGTGRLFRLPDLGEGLTDAEIIEWKVALGDPVEIDQIVVEVETAKAAVEVPVPYEGTVLRVHAPVGKTVEVGEPLITVGPAGADGPASGNVLVGYGTGGAPAARRRGRPAASPDPAPPGPAAPMVISPLVRRLARERGVDIAHINGSGPYGIILRRDVERAAGPRALAIPAERIPLRGTRRAVADKVSRSRATIPDVTIWVDADATELVAALVALRAAEPGRRIGLTAMLARICVAALTRFPDLNAAVRENEIVRYSAISLGIAVQAARGLMVPVVHGAHGMTAAELAAELARLTRLARSGDLPPAALTGGTFTLNNYGVYGVDGATPIINHPEVAMVGVGRVIDRPWVVDGALAVRKVTQLSLTFDHRVCDGDVAGGFLRLVADRVERPTSLLAMPAARGDAPDDRDPRQAAREAAQWGDEL